MRGEAYEEVPLDYYLRGPIRNGFSPSESQSWTGMQMLGLGCLTSDGFKARQLKNAPPGISPDHQAILNDGDILMSRANTRELVGLIGKYRDVGSPCIYPDLMMRLQPSELCLPDFLEILLRSAPVRRRIMASAQGTSESMVKISAEAVQRLRVPLIPPTEQQHIIAALDAAAQSHETAEKNTAKLRVLLSALTEREFSRVEGEQLTPLSSVATVTGGVTLGRDTPDGSSVELPYLRVANVQDGYIDTSELKTVRILSSEVSRYSIQEGDLILTEGGDIDKLGRGAVWDGRVKVCLHQNHLFRVQCKPGMNPHFLALYVSSALGRRYFLSVAKQTTNLATINSSQVKSMPVPHLNPEDQDQITQTALSIADQIGELENEQAKLRALKSRILDDLLYTRA